MRERALFPLRNFKQYAQSVDCWISSDYYVEEEVLKRKKEETLALAWDYWANKRNLDEWALAENVSITHTHFQLVRDALEALFQELESALAQIQVPPDRTVQLRIFFGNVAVDYDLPHRYELRNGLCHKLR